MTLPDGWREVRLGEVADTALGKMLDRGRRRGLPEVRYLRNVNVQWGRIDTHDLLTMELDDDDRARFGVEAGDLLVCEGGEVGRSAIWHGDGEYVAFQKALHRVRPHLELDSRFLRYALEWRAADGTLERLSTGSTIAHIPQQQLRLIPLTLPPEEEQRRIVELLEEHLSHVDAGATLVQASLKRLKASVRSVLTSLIPEPRDYLPGWRHSTIGCAGSVELGRQRHPDWHLGTNMRPYLRVANVLEDRIDTNDVKSMHWDGSSFERFRLRDGDILLNEGQSPELLGRPAIYRGLPEEIAFTNSLIRFQAGGEVLPDFALLVFRRHMHSGRFRQEARITTNIGHLSASRLKAIEFPIPPLNAQREIVLKAREQLAAIEALRVYLSRDLHNRARGLRRGLLQAAFSGQLTGHASDLDRAEELVSA